MPTITDNPKLVDSDRAGQVCSDIRLRDLFAAAALNGIQLDPNRSSAWTLAEIAGEAYLVADAMLAARAK